MWANSSFFATFLVFKAELGKVLAQASLFTYFSKIKVLTIKI